MTRARSSNRPYKSADLLEHIEGIINAPGEPNHGKEAELKHWRQYASRGYKTDYQRIEVHIIELWIEDYLPLQRWSYSGKHIAICRQFVNDARDLIREA